MIKLKILVTSDIHFEELEPNMYDEIIEYFKTSIENNKPNLLIFAGDTTDNRNMKVESDVYMNFCKFINAINKICVHNNVLFYILKGTPSHDGDNVGNIIKTLELEDTIKYVDSISHIRILGHEFLFIPEIYCAKYEDFKFMLDEVRQQYSDINGYKKFDFIIFHGMFDFAISQLKQIDSHHNLKKSIVMTSDDISSMAKCIIGGHVHKRLSYKNIMYTGRFINARGTMEGNDDNKNGIMMIDTSDNEYKVTPLINPLCFINELITIKFDDNLILDDNFINKMCSRNLNNTIFKCVILNTEECKSKFKLFTEIIKPLYIQKKFISKDEMNNITKIESTNFGFATEKELIELAKECYANQYNTPLSQELLDKIFTINDEDE